jgi:hypothetical protein
LVEDWEDYSAKSNKIALTRGEENETATEWYKLKNLK